MELDADLCERAMAISEETRVRTLDALHLAAAGRVMGAVMVTHDRGLARAARSLGLDVARV